MQIVNEVLMDTGRIIALILVSLAFLVSAMILFKPLWARSLNRKFNELFSTKEALGSLDQSIDTTDALLRHRVLLGSLFFVGSLFVLIYSLGYFEVDKFITYVIKPASRQGMIVSDLILNVLKWVFVVFSLAGVVCGIFILANPDGFRTFSRKLDRMFSTDETLQALDDMYSRLDSWVLQHHVLVGSFLFVGSIFLIVFCLRAFFG